jgi:hypothetical protein
MKQVLTFLRLSLQSNLTILSHRHGLELALEVLELRLEVPRLRLTLLELHPQFLALFTNNCEGWEQGVLLRGGNSSPNTFEFDICEDQ